MAITIRITITIRIRIRIRIRIALTHWVLIARATSHCLGSRGIPPPLHYPVQAFCFPKSPSWCKMMVNHILQR
jgi:hypothetical protein